MSRSDYDTDGDLTAQELAMYRGAVASATRGARGQRLLRDLLAALDAMPEKALVAESLIESDGAVCALGALGQARGLDLSALDPEEYRSVAAAFGVAPALVREIVYENDDGSQRDNETPECRWRRMRAWVARQITIAATEAAA